MDPELAVARFAATQYGLVTRAQARTRGLSDAAVDRRVAAGVWERVERSVFRLAGTPRSWEQAAKAATLAVPGSFVSHLGAAGLLELPGIAPRPQITVLHSRRVQVSGADLFRTCRLDSPDQDFQRGMPLTSVTRTVIDLAGVLEASKLVALLDHILAHRLAPLWFISARLAALGTRGRRNTGELAELIRQRAGVARIADSEFQRLFTRLLVEAGIELPAFEYPVRLPDGRMVFLDAFFLNECLGIEIDSYVHHSTLTDWSRDRVRAAELVALGIRMMSITTVELRDDGEAVLDRLRRSLVADPGRLFLA